MSQKTEKLYVVTEGAAESGEESFIIANYKEDLESFRDNNAGNEFYVYELVLHKKYKLVSEFQEVK